MTPFVRFTTTVLRSFTVDNTTNADLASTEAAAPQVQDWGLALWVCDKLRIPRVFASRSHLEGIFYGVILELKQVALLGQKAIS